MKGYTGTLASGEAIHYVDRKRWFWLMSVLYPLQPFLGIALHASTGNQWWLLLPVLLNYGVAPLIDMVIGEDTTNTNCNAKTKYTNQINSTSKFTSNTLFFK